MPCLKPADDKHISFLKMVHLYTCTETCRRYVLNIISAINTVYLVGTISGVHRSKKNHRLDIFNIQGSFTDFIFLAIGDQRLAWVIPLLLTVITVHLPTCPISLHHQSTDQLLPLIIYRHRMVFI
jgi:hypothetical protein